MQIKTRHSQLTHLLPNEPKYPKDKKKVRSIMLRCPNKTSQLSPLPLQHTNCKPSLLQQLITEMLLVIRPALVTSPVAVLSALSPLRSALFVLRRFALLRLARAHHA